MPAAGGAVSKTKRRCQKRLRAVRAFRNILILVERPVCSPAPGAFFLAERARSCLASVLHLRGEIRPNRINAPQSFAARCTASAQAHAFDKAEMMKLVQERIFEGQSVRMRPNCHRIQHQKPVTLLPGQLFYRLAARRVSLCPVAYLDIKTKHEKCGVAQSAVTNQKAVTQIVSPRFNVSSHRKL